MNNYAPSLFSKIFFTLFFGFMHVNDAMASSFEKAEQLFENEKYEQAITILRPLADSGDIKSQNLIGWAVWMLSEEEADTTKQQEALKYFHMAADAGDSEAAYNLSVYYSLDEKLRKANIWLLEAANRGHWEAETQICNYLNWHHTHKASFRLDDKQIFRFCNSAASSENPDSDMLDKIWVKLNLAHLYIEGIGTKKSEIKGFQTMLSAVEALQSNDLGQGYGQPFFFVAHGFHYGIGTEQNIAKAFKWYKLSAQDGHKDAQFAVAQLYGSGVGTLHNNIMAHMWTNIAASNGLNDAAEFRRYLESQMNEKEIKKAGEMAFKCKSSGYAECE